MATRTQKAATKAKKEAAAKEAKPAKAPKASKATKTERRSKAGAKGKRALVEFSEVATPPKPSWTERFWHALSGRAQKAEATAHVHAVEREHQHELDREAQKAADAKAAAEAKEAKRQQQLAERRKEAQSKRDLQRTAREEAARLKQEEKEAKLRAEREAKEAEARAAAEKVAEAERKKAEAAEKRRLAREAKAEEERRAAEEAERKKAEAAEKRRLAREAKAEEERFAAEAAAAAEAEEKARKEQQAAERAAAREAKAAAERAAADERKAKAAAEAAKPKLPPPSDATEMHADRLAAELASRRSKPVEIVADEAEEAMPVLPVGRHKARGEDETPPEELVTTPAPKATMPAEAHAPRGLSLPESYFLLALEEGWDERRERNKPGGLGAAIAGSMALELLLHGRLLVQRDRLTIVGEPSGDAAVEAVAAKLSLWKDRPALQSLAELAKWIPDLLPAWKERLQGRGLIAFNQYRHLGMFYRSQTELLDPDAKERLQGKLRRAIAGGGTPEATTILALGLLDASGLFGTVVPPGAQDYNRKRLNGLLAGRDVMGYVVDKQLKGAQEVAIRTVLDAVRVMTVRG